MNEETGLHRGWFTEHCALWLGRATALEIDHEICHRRSPFQDIQVFQTKTCGKMLALDGIIQFAESDEFVYQEMLAHVPLFAHPHPERVLVIGGGDGGVLREIARHPDVKEIDICEIDGAVIEVCRQYVPSMGCGFDDPRVRIHVLDGVEFMRAQHHRYDVIIVDSSDPEGPAAGLFGEAFYQDVREALRDGGVVAAQGESLYLCPDVCCRLARILRQTFPVWGYAQMMIPTYPGGNICVGLGSLRPPVDRPCRRPAAAMQTQLRYYTPEIHAAAFVLPAFADRLLRETV